MSDQPELFPDRWRPKWTPFLRLPARPPKMRPGVTAELRAMILREVPIDPQILDTPASVAQFWRAAVAPVVDLEKENFIVLFLNTRRKVLGFAVTGVGVLDSVLVHAREVFRPAIAVCAHAVILTHNHPAGDPSPSAADIRTTRDLIRAGQLLKLEVLDHVIIGDSRHASLKELGQFYSA